MIEFAVLLEDKLDHSTSLYRCKSIVEAWQEWWRLWQLETDTYDLGLELAMWVDDHDLITLYYEEWGDPNE